MERPADFYETKDVAERNMTLALRDMFATIARNGVTEDPLAVICKSAVRCLPDVQFAYYCYKGEETGHVAAIRRGVAFLMPPPDVERQIVAMLRRLALQDEVAVLESKSTRVLLPPADRKRWKDFTGFSLRVSDGVDSDAAVLALFMPATYSATPRVCVWMGLLADVASSFLARHRAFGKSRVPLCDLVADAHGANKSPRFRDSDLEAWVGTGLEDRRIKALVGVRGTKKSAVLQAIRERVLATGVAERRIVFIECEDASSRRFKTADDVIAYLAEFPAIRGTRYLFIDEPGGIDGHTELLKKLRDLSGWNVWLATSTAHALGVGDDRSGTGLSVHRLWTDPNLLRSRVDLEKYWYQIFTHDVVGGIDHPDIRSIEALTEYYSDHLGEVRSLRDVCQGMKSFGRHRVSRSAIGAYRQALADACLIEVSEIYDVFSGSVVSSVGGRIFFTDLELRTWRYGSAPTDEATRVALNRLYLELRRKYDKVYTPHAGDADFVTIEPGGKCRLWSIAEDPMTNPCLFRRISRLSPHPADPSESKI